MAIIRFVPEYRLSGHGSLANVYGKGNTQQSYIGIQVAAPSHLHTLTTLQHIQADLR